MHEIVKSESQLWNGFVRSSERFPQRPAIQVGREITYSELAERARRIAATIQAELTTSEIPLTAVFAYRSQTAYAAVLGALMGGQLWRSGWAGAALIRFVGFRILVLPWKRRRRLLNLLRQRAGVRRKGRADPLGDASSGGAQRAGACE